MSKHSIRETERKEIVVRWGRVLPASLATHVANVVVAVLLIVAYTFLAVGPQREPSGGMLHSQPRSYPYFPS